MLPLTCLSIQGPVNNSRCNSSSSETGVLVAVTGHGPTPPGGVHTITGGVTPSHHYCTLRRSENLLTYLAASHPRTRCPPGNVAYSVTVSLLLAVYITVLIPLLCDHR
ncbi:hypothetical protein AVEN_52780-1 [Araneus ventricosus]|uniref:Uncharacterized protein n=1 Tax=Araneus ventricosus TaxID=182803 RepID=A0A4Y2CXY8_ARAVE|nr:hypothetical protein AVEN_52780-1 [Araneus ventricosus]